MKKKLRVLAMLLVMTMVMTSLLAGCGGGNNQSGGNDSQQGGDTQQSNDTQQGGDTQQNSGGSTASGSVYWLNFKPESDDVLQQIAQMYTEETGVPVKVVTAASGTYSQTLNAEMDKSAPPTLFVIGNQAGVKDWADYALDLNGTAIANELNTDAYNLYDDSGKLVSIGYCYEAYGIIVNPDLLEQAGY